MPVIAIIGAGPGMGLAIAKTFGARGFNVALLSRSPAKLEPIVTELAEQGIEADAFSANVLDRTSIVSGLTAAKQHFGQIDVLEFSPADRGLPSVPATELTHDNVQVQIDFYAHGAVAAVNQVLPDMLARGSGTILFTTGASSVYPHLGYEMFGNVAPATAWLRNWAHGLHAALAPRGVQVGYVAIGAWIGRQPGAKPEAIAPLYWELHIQRDQVERIFFPETPSGRPVT
jgi:NAD(P)-dependent dehydrogenase (short-subunit alcohol dehydrogenase family)